MADSAPAGSLSDPGRPAPMPVVFTADFTSTTQWVQAVPGPIPVEARSIHAMTNPTT